MGGQDGVVEVVHHETAGGVHIHNVLIIALPPAVLPPRQAERRAGPARALAALAHRRRSQIRGT
eukprot:1800622-Lingulodinium_polyedra.AAC.1